MGIFDTVEIPGHVKEKLGKYVPDSFQTKYVVTVDGLVDVYGTVSLSTALVPITVFITLLVKTKDGTPKEPLLRTVKLEDIGVPVKASIEVSTHARVACPDALVDYMRRNGFVEDRKVEIDFNRVERVILNARYREANIRFGEGRIVLRIDDTAHTIPLRYCLEICGNTVKVKEEKFIEEKYDAIVWQKKINNYTVTAFYDTKYSDIMLSMHRLLGFDELSEQSIDTAVSILEKIIEELVKHRA